MEYILLKHSRNNNPKPAQFMIQKPIEKQSTSLPKINIETILTDFKVTSYPNILLVKPSRNDITVTLSKPDENIFIIIKDISASKKYHTTILCEDNEVKIDDAYNIILDEAFESLSLMYSTTDNKFYIY